uniref:hypothetical protein n=1 Tax=Stenotrophomonas maltophilia TaxID=40324 RepID=UPI001952EA7D
ALNATVAAIPDPASVLWIGSPGLAIALAATLPRAPAKKSDTDATVENVLIVAGSSNPVTHAQCEALRVHGIVVVDDPNDTAPLP